MSDNFYDSYFDRKATIIIPSKFVRSFPKCQMLDAPVHQFNYRDGQNCRRTSNLRVVERNSSKLYGWSKIHILSRRQKI